MRRSVLLVFILSFLSSVNFAQSTLLSWPLTTNYSTVVYSTVDLDNASYSRGPGIIESGLAADGGAWYNFTENDYIDPDDYIEIALSPKTGVSSQNVYITNLEFNLKQTPWFIYDGPTKYELYYSKNSDFSDSVLLDQGAITTNYTSGDITFTSPLTVFSGESIYFRLFGYLSEGWGDLTIEENQFIVKGYTENNPSVNPVPAIAFEQNCDTDGNLLFDLPSGFNASNETILIFAKANSAITVGASTALLSSYPSVDNDLSSFSGSPYEHDANAKLVYKGTSSGPQALTGMTAGTDYYFIAFNFLNNGGTGNISGASFGEGNVSGILPNVTSFSGVGSNSFVSLSFTTPNCIDALMIVAKESSINGVPSGDGSSYAADNDYLGSGSNFDGGKVVYNSVQAPLSNGTVDVINLNNGVDYYFKSYVRKGTSWSAGDEIVVRPNMAAIAFTQVQANVIDFFEFITLERQDISDYNITDQGVCASGAIYRSFSEWETEGFFNASGNPDVSNSLTDVPAGTFVKVYTGNTTVDDDFSDGLISLRNSSLNLSNSGDQVMVYTEPIPGPFEDCGASPNEIVAGINFADANDWITSGIPNDNTSYKPQTSGAFATLSSRGRSRYNNNVNLEGDSAAILAGLTTTANWQHRNNNADYWRLKKILFNQSDYQSGAIVFSNVSSNSIDIDASALLFDQASRSTRYIVVIRDNATPQNPVDRYSCYTVTNDITTTDDVVRNVTINYNNGNPCGTGQTLGNGKVVYFDYTLPSNLTVSGLSGCTTYHVSVHAVNGNGVTSNFGSSVVNQITTSSSGPPESTYYSQQSGNFSNDIWDDVTNGSANALPTLSPCLKLIVQSGHTVTMDIDASFGGLEIENGGTLILGTQTIALQRDLTLTGALTSNTGKIILNGSDGQQTIQTASEIEFYNLEINKASLSESNVLLIDGDVAVSNLLTILNGDLSIQTGNTLRLISEQADHAAALGPVPTNSNILGDFVIERVLPAVSTEAPSGSGNGVGWRYLAAPITNASFSSWNDDFITTGLTNSNYPNYTTSSGYYFPNLQFYDESIAGLQVNGFDGDANGAPPNIRNRRDITQSISPGQGVFAYLGPVPLTFDVQGSPFIGDLSVDVDYTDNSLPLEDGWNLIANPYPSAIDWKSVDRSAGIGNFAYIYDATGSGNFVIFDANATGDQLIASSNAFWVKTSQQATISFQESDKSLDVNVPFYKNADEAFNELYIHIHKDGDSSLTDFTRIRFMDEATNNYDVQYDALKLYSFNSNVPGLVTMIDSNDFAINSFSKNDTVFSIPMKAKLGQNGNYIFSFDLAGDYFNEVCLTLHDIEEDSYTSITTDETYQFTGTINEIEDAHRFELILSPTTQIETAAASCYSGVNGSISANTYGAGPFTYTIYNADNELVTSQETAEEFNYNELAYGLYTLEISGLTGNCATIQREFFIAQPAESPTHTLVSYATNCQGDNDGEIGIELLDSLSYTMRLYSNGELIQEKPSLLDENYFDHLIEGNYEVEIANECASQWLETEIISSDSMELDFELSAETIYLSDGGEIFCENTSENAASFNWFFTDDQDYAITSEDAGFTYTEAGSYDIYLFAKSLAGCSRFISRSIQVYDLANNIEEFDNSYGSTTVRYSNESIDLYFENIQSTQLVIKVLNELGQEVISTTVNPNDGIFTLSKEKLDSGIYFVHMQNEIGYQESKKIVIL